MMSSSRSALLSVIVLVLSSPVLAAGLSQLELANARGCFVCHQVVPDETAEGKPLGPSYQEVAVRYRDDPKAFDLLLDRVLHGTAYREQAWEGKVAMRFMPPNVNLNRIEAAALVRWILDLDVKPEVVDRIQNHDRMLALASYSGCNICHRVDPVQESRVVALAPTFREIAAHYKGHEHASQRLVQAVLEGTMGTGSRTWEHVNMQFMPPNANVKKADAERLVAWILELDTQGVMVRPKEPTRPVK